VEQFVKDALQLGFSFFVAGYLLMVMTNLIRELREQFVKLTEKIEQLAIEIRRVANEASKEDNKSKT
jgi:hypothetical protein